MKKNKEVEDLTSWLTGLPKAELHLHLEGTVAPETLVELAGRHPEVKLDLAAAQALYRYEDFTGFLMAFKAVTQLLRTPADYELITYEMLRGLKKQGVQHAEAYVSVGVIYFWSRLDFDPIFEGMERGRERGERDFGVSLLWIFDAVRNFGPEEGKRVFDKAAELKDRYPSIVGIGIGGDERHTGAEPFRELYAEARERGLRLTAHAGETVGPESVWAALNIGAERIGHGLTAIQDAELMEVLVERQIPVEINMTSNVKTGCLGVLAEHPVRRYFDAGVMVTLNSDDPAMFGSNLLEEYELAAREFEFSRDHLRELAANSIEASFLSPGRKLALLAAVERYEGGAVIS